MYSHHCLEIPVGGQDLDMNYCSFTATSLLLSHSDCLCIELASLHLTRKFVTEGNVRIVKTPDTHEAENSAFQGTQEEASHLADKGSADA